MDVRRYHHDHLSLLWHCNLIEFPLSFSVCYKTSGIPDRMSEMMSNQGLWSRADVAVLAGYSMMLVLNTFVTWKVKRSRIQREGLVECAHIRRSCRSQYVHGAKIKETSALVNRAVLRVTTPSHEGASRIISPTGKECGSRGWQTCRAGGPILALYFNLSSCPQAARRIAVHSNIMMGRWARVSTW